MGRYDGSVTVGIDLDTKSFDKEIAYLERKLLDLEATANDKDISPKEGTQEYRELQKEIETTQNKLIGLYERQKALTQQDTFKGIDLHLDSILKKVTRWGLALFGVRGAYSMIRRAMSTLTSQDDNLSAQIQYIQWTLANAIAPVIRFIINAVKLILDYVNKIWSFLFGFDLFKGPKEFAKSMKSASGSAQKIQKSLAGFDEMNILGDNTATSGGGGVDMPTFDTESVTEAVEKVKKKIKELKDTYVKSTDDMFKALADPKAFKEAYGNWDWLMMGVVETMGSINKVVIGFGDIFGGIWKMLSGLVHGNLKEFLDGFFQLKNGISGIFNALIGIISGIFMTILGVIKGVVLSIINFFSNIPTKIKEFFTNARDNMLKVFSADTGKKIGKALTDGISNAVKSGLNWIIDKINGFIKGMNKIKISVGGKDYGFNIKTIPKLARGTILNNPGRGVPIGGAIAGEAGREAVLPLSDTRLLEELGSTIGRYITINLTNETKLDGRTIARKVSELSQNDNFLRNR